MTNNKTPEADGPREIIIKKTTCNGCPRLRTAYWHETLENDETDSGTSAHCELSDRSITAYWYEWTPAPEWCPAKKETSHD